MGTHTFRGFFALSDWLRFSVDQKQVDDQVQNILHALLMGLLWFACITLYGAGASQLGKLGTTIGWLICMTVTVIMSNLWGMMTGDWEHAPIEAK